MIDIVRVRRETPACARMIHFNNAGASLMPEPVFEAVAGHLRLECEIGGYEAEDRAKPELDDWYAALGELLNCRHDELACVEDATRAWDMAFYSIPFKDGDRIITAEAEYASNYIAFLHLQKRKGVRIDVVPSDRHGQLDVDALERMVRGGGAKLIAITHVPTQSGLINPAAAVGRIAREHGILYLIDACQSVGQMPVDVAAIQCDMLSGTGRKFLRGPRGTGFLYVRKAILDRLEPPFLDLHAATWTAANAYDVRPGAQRFENWETFVAGRVGLRAAVRYALELGLPAIRERVDGLAAELRASLAAVPGVAVHDRGKELCGIVSFTRAGEDSEALKRRLGLARINVSTSTAASSRLDRGWQSHGPIVRASVHYYNTSQEIARVAAVVGGATG